MPLLIISPYAKPGYVTSQSGDFTSILKFMEGRFNLKHLTKRDDRATDMSDAFDFNQKPTPPLIIPVPAGLTSHYRKYNCTYQPSVPIAPRSIRLSPPLRAGPAARPGGNEQSGATFSLCAVGHEFTCVLDTRATTFDFSRRGWHRPR